MSTCVTALVMSKLYYWVYLHSNLYSGLQKMHLCCNRVLAENGFLTSNSRWRSFNWNHWTCSLRGLSKTGEFVQIWSGGSRCFSLSVCCRRWYFFEVDKSSRTRRHILKLKKDVWLPTSGNTSLFHRKSHQHLEHLDSSTVVEAGTLNTFNFQG